MTSPQETERKPIPSIIFFITFARISIIRIFWVSIAHCSQLVSIMGSRQLSNYLCQLTDLLVQLGAHRSKDFLQNFFLKHWTLPFYDIPSWERISPGISWLPIGGNPEFSVWAMIDLVSAEKNSTYLELLWKTSCLFTEKTVKKIFWNFGGTHPLCWRSRFSKNVSSL